MDALEFGRTVLALWGRAQKSMLDAQIGWAQEIVETLLTPACDHPAKCAGAYGGIAEANLAVTEWGHSVLDLCAAVAQPWLRNDAPGHIAMVLGKMLDPRQGLTGGGSEIAQMVYRLSEGLPPDDLWQVERMVIRSCWLWLELRRRSFGYNAVMLDAWARALQRFATQLGSDAEHAQSAENWRHILALWGEVANRTLLETQRSEPFLEAQSGLLRAGTQLRLQQREIAEHFADLYGLPTRTEIDEIHRSIHELRRDVRALMRATASLPPAKYRQRRTAQRAIRAAARR